MGISGLLQFIKDAAEPINVKKYKGQTVAVDTYCWLHKGAFSCAEKLAKREPTDQYVRYCMKFVEMLLTFRVKPILVFDGRYLPSKQEVEKARRERREANLQKGRQLLREGKVSEARDCFTRCVNITPVMAHSLIKVARARGVDCVVAPYEADAQLAYLTKCGLAQAVITEDSDLLAFGCKKVILKMDKEGNGLEIDQSNLGRCRSLGNVFTEEKFRYMCILSGCDYLPSLHGIGLGKACKLLRLAKDPDILKVIRKMGHYLKMDLVIPEEYVEGFIRANNTFLYQLVFDPVMRKVVPLNPYPAHIDVDTLSYAGCNLGDDIGLQLAIGNLDITTLERIDDFNPNKPTPQTCKARSHSWNEPSAAIGPSIWSRDFKPACPLASLPQSTASPDFTSRTRAEERMILIDGLRVPCRELQMKRPREDCRISDQDVLQQYSASSQKRSRSDQQPDEPTLTRHPLNPFATLLQRRNQEDDGKDTCSRFFSSCSSQVRTTESGSDCDSRFCATQQSPPIQRNNSSVPPLPSQNTPSPPSSQCSAYPRTASRGLRSFYWAGVSPSSEQSRNPTSTSGLVALQRFHYKTEISTKTNRSAGETTPTRLLTIQKDDLPDPLPSLDRVYFPRSKTDMQTDSGSDCMSEPEEKPEMQRSKVSVQSKPNTSSQATKVQMLGPARVSGLRKPKTASSNNENKPVVQATINSLWNNFSFKKNVQTIRPYQKGQ